MAEHATLKVGGHSIAYTTLGSGPRTTLFIHGFGSDTTVWSFNMPPLARTSTVYALDLPGHGQSGAHLADGSLAELVGVVAGFMDALGLRQAHLIGHSLGGAIAVKLAAGRPELAAALTLVAPAGIGDEDDFRVDAAFVADFLAMRTPEEARPVLARLVAKPSLVSVDMVANVLRHNQAPGVIDALGAIACNAVHRDLRDRSVRDSLLSLQIPVEIIWGVLDAIIPVDAAAGLPETIPIHRIEAAGHLVQMEKAPAVNAIMMAQNMALPPA